MFVESVISAIMLLSTPMLPLRAPLRLRLQYGVIMSDTASAARVAHLTTRPQKVRDRPKLYMDNESPKSPVMMTGFRPTRSDKRLQCSTVMACVAKKRECCIVCCETMDCVTVDTRTHHQADIISNLRLVAASNANVADELYTRRVS